MKSRYLTSILGSVSLLFMCEPSFAQVVQYLDANNNPKAVSVTNPLPSGGNTVISGTDAGFSVASTTSVIINHSGTLKTYITHLAVVVSAAETVTIEYGTGSTCGTGTTTVAPYPFAANGGISEGVGNGAVYIIPAGQDTCMVSGSATAGGHVVFVQQ